MHHANHWYGHAHVMARYAEIAQVPRIWGYLQHGWNVHDGYAVGTVFAPRFPKFVWSEVLRRRGWAAGLRNYLVVGAPWAYLLKLEQQRAWERSHPAREGTIVYPFHGWEGQEVIGSHDRYVDEIKATEDGPITVCLYWNEYRVASIRRTYEQAGFRVITHGYRGYRWQGTDSTFLDKQLSELRAHRRVVSNRLSTAIFYGASVGCEVGIYGDPMILVGDKPVFGGVSRQKRLWPEFHQPVVPRDVAREMSRLELGTDLLLSPVELIEAFGWHNARRQVKSSGPRGTEGDLSHDEGLGDPVDPKSASDDWSLAATT